MCNSNGKTVENYLVLSKAYKKVSVSTNGTLSYVMIGKIDLKMELRDIAAFIYSFSQKVGCLISSLT